MNIGLSSSIKDAVAWTVVITSSSFFFVLSWFIILMPPRNQRGWWRDEFYDHPGLAAKLPDAYTGNNSNKFKLFCKRCYDRIVAETMVHDERDVAAGIRDVACNREAIIEQRKIFPAILLHQTLLIHAPCL